MFTMELLELVEDKDTLETREAYWISIRKPTLNVTDTKLSKAAADSLKIDSQTLDKQQLCEKYNLSQKYLNEILRGGRW